MEVGGRQISSLAAATEDTDTVNLKQLKDTVLVDGSGNALNAMVYDAGPNNNSVTFFGTNGSVLNNVTNGTIAAGSMQAIRSRRYATTCKVRSPISTIASAKVENNSGGIGRPEPYFVSGGDKKIPAAADTNSVA